MGLGLSGEEVANPLRLFLGHLSIKNDLDSFIQKMNFLGFFKFKSVFYYVDY
jgi:hypothetical protein